MNTTLSALREMISMIVGAINTTGQFKPLPDPLIGEETITSAKSPPTVFWIPREDDGYRPPHEQPDDGQAYYETTVVCDVKAWGSDLDEATRLRDAILIAGHVLFSPNAFIPQGKGTYSKGLSTGEKGVQITFRVGFVVPVMYVEFQTALITNTILNPPDAGPAPTPPDQPILPVPVAPPDWNPGGLYTDDALGSSPELLPP